MSVASSLSSITSLKEETSYMHTTAPSAEEPLQQAVMEQILDLARWAPSGDNSQPWRFEIVNEHHVVIHGFDTRDHCVYDLDGRPSQIALGALLETVAIAASRHGLRTLIQRRMVLPETTPTFDIFFESDLHLQADPLIPFIVKRSVQRRPMRTRPLTSEEKQALETAAGDAYRIIWIEGFGNKWRTARLMFANAKLRLTIPEAYEVHRTIIEWNARFSEDRVPDQALGLDPMTLRLMHWVMQSWKRVAFFNTFLAGTWAPRIQMDLIPGMACAAHFAIVAHKAPETIEDYVAAGRAVQRFWLTATSLGLQLQPEMTPLIFGRYTREERRFSRSASAWLQAQELAGQLKKVLANDTSQAVFLGRLGHGTSPWARSLRMSAKRLTTPS
jgi:hypothetical protein